MNSSVFKMKTGSLSFVYDKFMENAPMNMRRFHGDQDWIYDMLKDRQKDWVFWPDQWIMSYKWEILHGGVKHGCTEVTWPNDYYQPDVNWVIPQDCSVVVYHGKPSPYDTQFGTVYTY